MSKTALAGEQEAVGRKIFKRRREAFTNDFRGFQHIAALVDHAERQGTFEIPLLPQLHQIVSERAVLERDFIDLYSAEGRHEVAIPSEINPLSPRVATADVQPELDARQRIDQTIQYIRSP